MSLRNRVTWTEGLFLQPQHFQQHLRYVEHYVGALCPSLRPYAWGLTDLDLDDDLLKIGKVAIRSASGVFPDGTPFNIPHDDAPPQPLELDERTRETVVHLALPVRRDGVQEVAGGGDKDGLARYVSSELDVTDVHTPGQRMTKIHVGQLRTRLLLEKDEREGYTSIGIGYVVEQRSDNSILLGKEYIPTILDCSASPRLSGFIAELRGLFHSRAEELAGRVSGTGRGTAEVGDFLLLQLMNRAESLLVHLGAVRGLHPEDLFRHFLEFAGELATYLVETRRPGELPTYRHHDLQASFEPLLKILRRAPRGTPTAQQFPLEDLGFGIYNADIADKNLLKAGRFVFAVRADIGADDLLARVRDLIKVAALENIRPTVMEGVRGIPFRALAVAPKQIPFHTGFAYFELEQRGHHWSALENSGGLAIYLPETSFPNFGLELWWIGD